MSMHPNSRAAYMATMKKLLLAHNDVDTTLDLGAEQLGISKRLAAELIPKDSRSDSRELLGLFIAAEITTHLATGLPAEKCVDAAMARFDVTPPKAFRDQLIRSFEHERERLSTLRKNEFDNGVGGTMRIVNASGNPIQVGGKPS